MDIQAPERPPQPDTGQRIGARFPQEMYRLLAPPTPTPAPQGQQKEIGVKGKT